MRTFLLFLVLSFNFACGQTINCEEILNKQPNFLKNPIKSSNPLFIEDIKILKHCGNFTEEDSLLFKGPIIGSLMVKQFNQWEILTYGKIITLLQSIKNDPRYKNLHLTPVQGKNSPKAPEKRFEFKLLDSYENALLNAKTVNKKLLLFFTGHACVPGLMMEEKVLIDSIVKNLLAQNFVCFKANLDEQTELPAADRYFSKAMNRQVKTIGEKFIDLQLSKFKSDMQPHFIILDTNGKQINQLIGYQDKKKFLSFLHTK